MKTILPLLLAGLVSSAHADETAADSCLKTKIWDGYATGWAVRTATTTSLAQGEHRIYLVTLYANAEYKVMACGDDHAVNIDVVLYDALGNEVIRDQTNDREPVLSYRPTATDTFYVAVHATKSMDASKKAGIATAVTYK